MSSICRTLHSSIPLALVALALGLSTACRTHAPSSAEERGAQLVGSLVEAIDGVKEVRYSLRQYESDRPTEVQQGLVAVVVPDVCDGFAMARWRFCCTDANGALTSEYAFDGSVVQHLDPSTQLLLEAEIDGDEANVPDEVWVLRPQWLYEIKCARIAVDPAATTWLRSEVVDGIACEVIETRELLDFGADGTTLRITRRAIAREDHLPRRIESIRCDVDADPNTAVATVVEIEDLRVRALAGDPLEYRIELPEGFVRREVSEGEIAGRTTPEHQPLFAVGEVLPDFELSDAAGTRQRLCDLRGNVVLLDFWASWCGPCLAAMPELQQIQQAFRDQSVRVVGMNMDEDAALANRCMQELGCDYLSLLEANAYAESVGVVALPTLVVLDRDGVVVHIEVGVADDMAEQLTDTIHAALASASQ